MRRLGLMDRAIQAVGLLSLIAWTYFPVYWLLTMSLKTRVDILAMPPLWIFKPTFTNYAFIFQVAHMVGALERSTIVATTTVAVALALGMPAAYGIARFRVPRKKDLEFWILSTRMLPPIAVLIPFYMIWAEMHMLDTYLALVVTYLVTILPLVVWLMRGFFQDLPVEHEEAGLLEGLSWWGAFVRVAVPQSLPGISVTAMLAFLFAWNEYFFAFVLTSSHATLPVAVASFLTHGLEVKYGEMAAAGVFASLPALVFLLIAHRIVIRGLTGLVR